MPAANLPTSESVTNATSLKTMSISRNICPRCSKAVYSSFHKHRSNCAHCKGSISSVCYCERNGKLYDKNCYQRLFDPRGVGFGVDAGALSTGN